MNRSSGLGGGAIDKALDRADVFSVDPKGLCREEEEDGSTAHENAIKVKLIVSTRASCASPVTSLATAALSSPSKCAHLKLSQLAGLDVV